MSCKVSTPVGLLFSLALYHTIFLYDCVARTSECSVLAGLYISPEEMQSTVCSLRCC